MSNFTDVSLIDLPFRVVVYKILVYHDIDLNTLEGEFDCFGYFKSDRSRKIFLIFTSYSVEKDINRPIDPSNVVSLFFWNIKPQILTPSKLILFKKLEVLNLSLSMEEHNYGSCLKEMLPVNIDSLPKLESLYIDYYSIEEHDTVVDSTFWFTKNIHIWKNLVDLTLNFSRFSETNYFPLEKHSHIFKNLRSIYLGHIRAPTKSVIHLTNIRKILLEDTERILIHAGSPNQSNNNPVSLKLRRISISEVKDMIQLGNQFSELEVNGCEYTDDFGNCDFLFRPESIRKQRYLKSMSLYQCKVTEGTQFQVGEENLENLSIGQCSNFELTPFLGQTFPSLTELNLFSFEDTNYISDSTQYPFTNHLKTLYIESKTLPSDNLFTKNEFSQLEVLKIKNNSDSVSEVEPEEYYKAKWSEMPKLRLLELYRLTTKIMTYQTLPSLEFISLRDIRPCSKWNPINLQKLKRIEIGFHNYDYELINGFLDEEERKPILRTDVIFTENKFPVLHHLHFFYCDEVYGVGWNSIPSLRSLRIQRCKNFEDHLFQGEVVKNLEVLKIRKCEKIKQVNWIRFEKMREKIIEE